MSTSFLVARRIKSELTILIVTLVGCVALIGTQPRFAASSLIKSNPSGRPESQTREPLEAELVVLKRTGFHPTEIRRPPGRFLLALHNFSGLEEISLQLKLVAGSPVKDIRLPKGHVKLRDHIDLPPGLYVLTEANHPDWICRIIITPL